MSAVATDEKGRALVPCGSQAPPPWPKGWANKNAPTCNRVSGHDGPHRQIDRRSFGVQAEWEVGT